MLTIVIPIKQSWVKPDCFIRLFLNLFRLYSHGFYSAKFNVLVADDSHLLFKPLNFLISKLFRAKYLSVKHERSHKFYSPAMIKNLSANYVFSCLKSESVFFLDVDVLLMDENIEMLAQMTEDKIPFYWLTIDFLGGKHQIKSMYHFACKNNYDHINNADIIQTGYVTGAQLINHSFFNVLNGYSEDFIGYGCEDIEMIHRATLLLGERKAIKDNDPYYIDDRGYNPENLKGFRNFYFKYKTNNQSLDQCDRPKHFYHSRKNSSDYLKSRNKNDLIMIEIMKNFDRNFINGAFKR